MQFLFYRFFVTFLLYLFGMGGLFAGTVVIKGSDTLGAKLLPQMVEAYKATLGARAGSVSFEIAAEGSATGIAAILEGSADIGMLSREIGREEYASAKNRGIDLQLQEIARDGLAIIVNEKNPISALSAAEVEAIFAGDYANWAALSLFAGEISIYTRGTASGSYFTFQELALNRRNYSLDSQKLAGNEQIASEVASNAYGIGYVGLAYAQTPGVKVVPIAGVWPDQAGYAYARPLYLLTNAQSTLTDEARDFLEFCNQPAGRAIVERVNFLPPSDG